MLKSSMGGEASGECWLNVNIPSVLFREKMKWSKNLVYVHYNYIRIHIMIRQTKDRWKMGHSP